MELRWKRSASEFPKKSPDHPVAKSLNFKVG